MSASSTVIKRRRLDLRERYRDVLVERLLNLPESEQQSLRAVFAKYAENETITESQLDDEVCLG